LRKHLGLGQGLNAAHSVTGPSSVYVLLRVVTRICTPEFGFGLTVSDWSAS